MGHAVLQLNTEDASHRRFILVEMDEPISRAVCAERLTRVIRGIGGMAPLAGGFRFCRLGAACFNERGQINPEVSYVDLARHVFFAETGEPLPKQVKGDSPLIGIFKGKAVFLLYNGVLKDKRLNGGNVLTQGVLEKLPECNGTKVIYGTACRLSPSRLKRENIIFKQIPYEIKVR